MFARIEVERWAAMGLGIKLDGYRAIAVKSGRTVNLYSRRKKSFNSQYPFLVESLGDLPDATVVDGEVVALD
jgi:bifunctional non-homologous end joining protein LigD